jgi:hypothetical protein
VFLSAAPTGPLTKPRCPSCAQRFLSTTPARWNQMKPSSQWSVLSKRTAASDKTRLSDDLLESVLSGVLCRGHQAVPSRANFPRDADAFRRVTSPRLPEAAVASILPVHSLASVDLFGGLLLRVRVGHAVPGAGQDRGGSGDERAPQDLALPRGAAPLAPEAHEPVDERERRVQDDAPGADDERRNANG